MPTTMLTLRILSTFLLLPAALSHGFVADDFESEPGGNRTSLSHWIATRGDIDVVQPCLPDGANDTRCIDLDGFNSARLESRDNFSLLPGVTYLLRFDLSGAGVFGGVPHDGGNAVVVSVGSNYQETFSKQREDPTETIVRTFQVAVPTDAHLVFDHVSPSDRIGLRLDNVYFEVDMDGDATPSSLDNCPVDPNTDQLDTDGDSRGDACDPYPFLAGCEAEREQALDDLSVASADDDSDGIPNLQDRCSESESTAVDNSGCTARQVCAGVDATTNLGRRTCRATDWKNDEPLMTARTRDCHVEGDGKGRADDRCLPVDQ